MHPTHADLNTTISGQFHRSASVSRLHFGISLFIEGSSELDFACTFCDRFRRGPSATANYSTRRVRDLSPRWQAAGSRCIQPSHVLQDLVHSRRAGSRGDCVKRELEQRAGEGPLGCYGNDAAPAGHVGCTQGRADGSVRARSARLCKEPQEGRGFRAPAATNLDGENHKVAALPARQLGVVCRDACALLRAEARSRVGSRRPAAARQSE